MKIFTILLFLFVLISGTYTQPVNGPYMVIDSILVSGNNKTVDAIIKRELTFKPGDTIALKKLTSILSENKDNLLKTSLFNYVTITLANVRQNRGSFKIIVEERWYLWPELYFAHADRNLSNFIKSADWSRIKYGAGLTHYNFRGRKEKFGFLFISGFVNRYALTYRNFYLDKKLQHSLSAELFYDTPKKLVYDVEQNEELVLKAEDILIVKKEGYLDYNYRQNLYTSHNFRIGYLDYNISDTILSLNPDYLETGLVDAKFPTISYAFTWDKRNSVFYPTSGFHTLSRAKHVGLINNETNFWQFNQELSFYKQLFNFPLFIGTLNKAKLTTTDKRPLFMYDEIGYRDNLRGFEYYVVNGKYALMTFNTIKYRLFKTRIVELDYIPIPSINKVHFTPYLNIFFDAGYVGRDALYNRSDTNLLVDELLTGMGIGIDVVTYYDRVLSVYYSYNSINEGGFYISISSGY
ncbi:MAG: BamA/TamA family outer membrane protein [Bacteroidetes bacterium]|jgi:outer membrane protein assembly factor BamA|nr:BamA/TamA family outer membrane protein [Bacteroidota bacterium]